MGRNPALASLEPLVGNWTMELYGAAFLPTPDTRVTGSVDINWIQGGAAVAMRQGDSEHPPAAVWIVGHDESEDDYTVLYADDRGVSRVYRMSIEGSRWRMWRDTPEFLQRFEAEVASDGQQISGRWEKSLDQGADWQHDFNIDYIRDGAPSSEA
jgi:hypothetical protein